MSKHPPVAIVGMSALFPDSVGCGSFWQNIVDGRDLIRDVPPSHWLIDDYYDPEPGDADKTYCKRGGFLPDVDFDPVAYGIPPNMIPATDTTQLLALIVARQVLEDAFAEQFSAMDKEKMSIILGVTAGQELLIQAASRLQRPQWLAALREEGIPEDEAQKICDRIADKYTPWQESTFPGLLGNVVAGRIANRFDLGGTNCITDAACASSLSALSMGLNELYLGHSDVVLTGGVDCFNDIFMYMCFSKTPALSKSGDCRPFADGADGTLMGEGMGMFALKRLDEAEAAGDEIYAVIKGLGSSSDGRSLSVYAPLPEGQAKAIGRAHERAGVAPETVELVEAHGTGTKAGDVAEFEGLREAFGADKDSGEGEPWCALGSIKSQVGHTKAAAGAAGLFKVVMALHHGILPPTIKVDRPNPKLPVDESPFYVNTEARPWIRGDDHPRRAGISSFGFGGSNFHVVVEEYRGEAGRPGRKRTLPSELFAWSAASSDKLRDKLLAEVEDLNEVPEQPGERRELLAFVARRSQRDFESDKAHRFAMTASDLGELVDGLLAVTDRLDETGDEEFELPGGAFYRSKTRSDGDVAMLFPGQGSQYVGMGAQLAMHFDAARAVWDEAAQLDFDLHHRVYPPPAFDEQTRIEQRENLTATEWAQPALGADSAARFALLKELGLTPKFAAGHSFGEVSALFAAGVWDRKTMLKVARKRGELMADAARSTSGAMTAVRASAGDIAELLDESDADVVVANDNSPGQVVVSGPLDAIEAAEAIFDEELLAFQRLPVDTAFHSEVVAEATEPFAEFLAEIDISAPELNIYANASAGKYGEDPEKIRATLTSQIENPVRFVEMIQTMVDDGAQTFVEVGAHDVLTGLAKRCLAEEDVQTVSLDRRSAGDMESFFSGLAALSSLGVELNFGALWQGYDEPEDPRQREKSKFTVKLNGANYERPYPPAGGASDVPKPNISNEYINGSTTQESTMSRDDYSANGATPPTANGRAPRANGHDPHYEAPRQTPQPAQQTRQTQPADPAAARAFAEYQRSLAESHMAYLRVMEQSVTRAQIAYMEAMETSFRQWCGGEPAPAPEMPQRQSQPQPSAGSWRPEPAPAPRAPAPQQMPPQHMAPQQAPPAPRYEARQPAAAQPPAPQPAAPAPVAQPQAKAPVQPSTPAQTNGAAPPAEPTNDAAPADLTTTFMDVVADKTGYPVDMIEASMALEADLGIDSIKRVEILSAVQEEVPSLPELDPNAMASLKTVGEIIGYLEDSGPADSAAVGGRLGK